uniref:DNA binding protein n=2 Tax=Solanum tuberosum TaxID=4113 RepID=M1D4Y2_SOLTU
MDCSLSLSSGEVLNVNVSRMICWERKSSKIFLQRLDKSGGYKSKLEYATYFSEVVAEGILKEKEDFVPQLAELIKLGFILKFDEAAIEFLMKTENLQIFLEDEEFLSSAFTSE